MIPAAVVAAGVFGLKLLLASGVVAGAGAWLAKKIPAVNVHTSNQRLNVALDLLGNACEAVVKAELNGPLLEQLARAAANGQSMAGPIVDELPRLRQLVLDQVGPSVQAALNALLKGDNAAELRATTELLAKARDFSLEHARFIVTLPDGHKLVAPAAA